MNLKSNQNAWVSQQLGAPREPYHQISGLSSCRPYLAHPLRMACDTSLTNLEFVLDLQDSEEAEASNGQWKMSRLLTASAKTGRVVPRRDFTHNTGCLSSGAGFCLLCWRNRISWEAPLVISTVGARFVIAHQLKCL